MRTWTRAMTGWKNKGNGFNRHLVPSVNPLNLLTKIRGLSEFIRVSLKFKSNNSTVRPLLLLDLQGYVMEAFVNYKALKWDNCHKNHTSKVQVPEASTESLQTSSCLVVISSRIAHVFLNNELTVHSQVLITMEISNTEMIDAPLL